MLLYCQNDFQNNSGDISSLKMIEALSSFHVSFTLRFQITENLVHKDPLSVPSSAELSILWVMMLYSKFTDVNDSLIKIKKPS